MLIVPIGNVLLQGPDVDRPDLAFQVMENIAWALPGIIGQMLNKHLEMEITRFLGRGPDYLTEGLNCYCSPNAA